MDNEYIVTLYRKEDLEKFYNEMKLTNFPLVKKRPISRNTHYMMTEDQAEKLRQDPRVWGVEEVDKFVFATQTNNEPYNITGSFWKDDTVAPAQVSWQDYQWGHVHCAGDASQRGKTLFGTGGTYESLNTSIDVFNTGKNVDVVIVDDSVSYDNGEWLSPSTGLTRFVQYQWFNELNTIVSSIEDDGQTLPTGTIVYDTSAAIPQYHGIHVTGTTCGQHYGWAREANIYNIAITSTWPSGQSMGGLIVFDYLRAFHQSKPVNPETGRKNPTITNHSYGSIINMPQKGSDPATEQPIYRLDFADVSLVQYRGVVYDSNNPNPSGWTQSGLETDCGVRFGGSAYPGWSSAIAADVQDAIEEGVVIIGAAGNDNLLIAEVGDQDYNNILGVSGVGNFYYHRGGAPNTPDSGAINVGALSNETDFRRSTYTMFGPAIDIFAPGDNILSSFSSAGLADTKYGAGNYFYPIQGTSMASPQVCGVIACVASTKVRFTQKDAYGFLNQYSIYDDMTFDLASGGFDDSTCQFESPNKYLHIENPRKSVGYIQDTRGDRNTGLIYPRVSIYYATPTSPPQTYTFSVGNSGASDYTFTGSDRDNTFSNDNDPTINCNAGDTLVFDVIASGHPFWIKTSATTGTGNLVTTGTITGNGEEIDVITWDTTGVTPGTYYYICQYHSFMSGDIIVS